MPRACAYGLRIRVPTLTSTRVLTHTRADALAFSRLYCLLLIPILLSYRMTLAISRYEE
jgi:hypothetical protein